MSRVKRVGVLGTGKIASAVVRGLCRSELPPASILLSPRNPQRAAALAAEFDSVEIAASNQEVLDQSDLILIALRPDAAPSVLEALRFREAQEIISFIPTILRGDMNKMVAPAGPITRATPLPPCARHRGAVLVNEASPTARELLEKLGELLDVDAEPQLHYLWALSGLITPFFAVMAEMSDWAHEAGVETETAERYVAAMCEALCATRRDESNMTLRELAEEAATPGGLNEGAHRELSEAGTYSAFSAALDRMMPRFGEPPVRRG